MARQPGAAATAAGGWQELTGEEHRAAEREACKQPKLVVTDSPTSEGFSPTGVLSPARRCLWPETGEDDDVDAMADSGSRQSLQQWLQHMESSAGGRRTPGKYACEASQSSPAFELLAAAAAAAALRPVAPLLQP